LGVTPPQTERRKAKRRRGKSRGTVWEADKPTVSSKKDKLVGSRGKTDDLELKGLIPNTRDLFLGIFKRFNVVKYRGLPELVQKASRSKAKGVGKRA